MPRAFYQAIILTLVFSFFLCWVGPAGSGREDPLSRWLIRHSPFGQAASSALSGDTAASDGTRAAPAMFGLLEWIPGLITGALAVLFVARLPLSLALCASGILALLVLAMPLVVVIPANRVVTSNVPLISIGFGLLTAFLIMRPQPPPRPDGSPLQQPAPARPGHGLSSGGVLPEEGSPPDKDLSGPTSSNGDFLPTPDARMTIGRYEIIRPIGKGAMGEVFLGRDPHINRLTAIKTVHFEETFAEDDITQIKVKFFREAESAGALSHPHIVTIYDAGEDGDSAYIAMEFLEGSTLLQFSRRKRLLPLRRLIRYMVQVAEALDYAHAQGVIHRDIKPANIMLMHSGFVKITDFGIAHLATSSQTRTGVVKGTPYYMSPEQFSGQKVDGRSDIFSLGTSMFQLLTGTLPFYAESPALLMNQIMNFPHPNPRAINPRIIPAMVAIVDRTLEKDRGNRYPTAGELAADLRRLDKRIKAALSRENRAAHGGRAVG